MTDLFPTYTTLGDTSSLPLYSGKDWAVKQAKLSALATGQPVSVWKKIAQVTIEAKVLDDGER